MFSELASNLKKKIISYAHYNKVSREKIDDYLELSIILPIFAIDM